MGVGMKKLRFAILVGLSASALAVAAPHRYVGVVDPMLKEHMSLPDIRQQVGKILQSWIDTPSANRGALQPQFSLLEGLLGDYRAQQPNGDVEAFHDTVVDFRKSCQSKSIS